MTRQLVILGSTGSIGTQALEVLDAYHATERGKAHPIRVAGLGAGQNIDLLEQQIRKYRPHTACVHDGKKAADLAVRVRDLDVRIISGMEGMIALAELEEADTVLTSVVGMIGIRPTIAAIRAGKNIALANKETLVAAGEIIMPLVTQYGVRMLPVDSEHSAIFQCLAGADTGTLEEILLTASGGPFRGKTKAELARVTKEEALRHPNWSMGAKITIDSATLVNKGLEVIEAMHLFGTDADHIRIVVQPESIIHSMVRFTDGSILAQMGLPDMKLPIHYALFYPDRMPFAAERLDFYKLGSLHFEAPDPETFEGLSHALRAARTKGTLPAVFNAANEAAVALFLRDRIRFDEIAFLIGEAMGKHHVIQHPQTEDIFAAEEEARRTVIQTAEKRSDI
ncbi:MAG: 1-deoxy-D-xylulose-5-phosphate reductoisomerase [Lachnospiraceae bacterium]|nr:1-deoxy-D-xylulose-5-phosphate reductoisomerase [Lachnospiraceae bacterium]